MAASNDKLVRILFIFGPYLSHPDLTSKKLNEVTVKMDKHWKLFGVTSHLPSNFIDRMDLPCSFELHTVPMLGSRKSIMPRIAYLFRCIPKGVKLVKKENIHVITQHDGHLEYGVVAYIVSRLTHRQCLIRVNEDTLIPLIFFLKASGNFLFRSKTVLKIVAFIYRRIEYVFFKHVDWIITHGPMDYRKIKEVTRRITFLPLWVDTEKFKPLNKEVTRKLRENFVPSKDVKIMLFVGRLHPEKGVKTLLKALKIIQNMEILLLMVYAVSEYKEEYERLIEQLKISEKVRFVGYISHDDLPKYYNIADLYVLLSMREEWSNTIMEAMACKTPVIATEVGGNPYLITERKTGFLVPPNDPWSFAKRIKFVLENPDLIRQVTETAANEIKKYDKDKIGELYKTVIKNLVKDFG